MEATFRCLRIELYFTTATSSIKGDLVSHSSLIAPSLSTAHLALQPKLLKPWARTDTEGTYHQLNSDRPNVYDGNIGYPTTEELHHGPMQSIPPFIRETLNHPTERRLSESSRLLAARARPMKSKSALASQSTRRLCR